MTNSFTKPEKVINDKHLELEFDPALNCITQTWKGYFSSELFRQGVNRTNQLFNEKAPVAKFLVDISESGVIKQEDTNWAARISIPAAIEKGLTHYALVAPKNVFTQMSLYSYQQELNQLSLQVRLFDTFESALEWLKSI